MHDARLTGNYPHPDDAELGKGSAILEFKSEGQSVVTTLAEGSFHIFQANSITLVDGDELIRRALIRT
ncbi:hypothetical protein Pr1d_06470 [Bythopirellula goksoeyrii]|uniref:Uncharacterized protein n=1 Tax=Bythopirellula goksoeyrii TaxID=1400387 RepID=A0A5B9Q8Y9_9BACT|nr:hypothetical protein Pr1d_06470 [Bythopirellula goksoeyrii]